MIPTVGTFGGSGYDQANLYDSAGNDTFYAYPTFSTLSGAGFYNSASGFESVSASATAGGNDQAYLFDSAGNDTFYGRSDFGALMGIGFYNFAQGFDRVSAVADAGGIDTLDVNILDYIFAQYGSWER